MIDYEIEKHETYSKLLIKVFGDTVIVFYYEPGAYLDEYVKSTIVPGQLQKWLDNEISKLVSGSEKDCCQGECHKKTSARGCRCASGRCASKISKPEQPSS